MRIFGLCVALVAVLPVAGCSTKIHVESDTSWTGDVNGGTVAGSGNRTYQLHNDSKCYTFQKDTEAGHLDVKGGPSTDAAYGVVSGCAN